MSGGGSSQAGGSGASASASAAEADDCCICQEGLADPVACADLGEPLQTACGHRFHAVCFARLMEESRAEHDPPCPMCRANIDAVRFV